MKIAYLGPIKTFTEKAARELFPDGELIPIPLIRHIVRDVDADRVDYGVIPIENFYNGEVRETLDSLTEASNARITQEKALTIVHCIGALPHHKEILKIFSKDQALEQCSRYLCEKYPAALTIASQSTAEAAERIVKEGLLDAAAIAPEAALKSAGLEILATDICPNNRTRFVAIGREHTKPTGDDKTFLAIHPQIDKPGILAGISNAFTLYGINLEYFQSRPDGKRGYIFYVELDGHQTEERVIKAMDAVKYFLDPESKFPNAIKVLGSYKNTHWKNDN